MAEGVDWKKGKIESEKYFIESCQQRIPIHEQCSHMFLFKTCVVLSPNVILSGISTGVFKFNYRIKRQKQYVPFPFILTPAEWNLNCHLVLFLFDCFSIRNGYCAVSCGNKSNHIELICHWNLLPCHVTFTCALQLQKRLSLLQVRNGILSLRSCVIFMELTLLVLISVGKRTD